MRALGTSVALGTLVCALGCSPRLKASIERSDSATLALLHDGAHAAPDAAARSFRPALQVQPVRADVAQACAPSAGSAQVVLPARVTLGDFWKALAAQVELLDTRALEPTFQAFAARHRVDPETPGLRQDFVRLWTAFEATRDGGWWRLRWDITDQQPSSIKIWKAWLRSTPDQGFGAASAVAECDEITALFSVTARHLGVRGVGLYYPTWNHVIAGWIPQAFAERKSDAVVLVPTTQIFQGCDATFDQTTFTVPRRVYEYPRADISDWTELPQPLAGFLLEQVRVYGEASPSLLALIRAKRAFVLGSSLGSCEHYRRQLVAELPSPLTCADQQALRHLALEELNEPDASQKNLLSWLAAP
ncbi:MAG TPA: hypothetical protein VJN18_34035 [Polyangiaceae bacterium]|nr:hypothetical protein [Polyangiaceae bacterium]